MSVSSADCKLIQMGISTQRNKFVEEHAPRLMVDETAESLYGLRKQQNDPMYMLQFCHGMRLGVLFSPRMQHHAISHPPSPQSPE